MQEGALSSHLFHFRHARRCAASLAKEKSNEGVALRPASLVLFSKSPFRNSIKTPSLSSRYGDLLLWGQNIYYMSCRPSLFEPDGWKEQREKISGAVELGRHPGKRERESLHMPEHQ